MLYRADHRRSWQMIAAEQHGVISRAQLVGLGMSRSQAWQGARQARWQTLYPGVYAAFTGPVPPIPATWAAVLYAGRDACASHESAVWLAGLRWIDATASGAGGATPAPKPIRFVVPHERRVSPQPGLRINRSRSAIADRNPSAAPPRVRVERAVLDFAAEATATDALDAVLRATQRRLTTAARIRAALVERSRHPWRNLLLETLADVEEGVASPLEWRYLTDVERRHRLPRGERNLPEVGRGGVSRYRDVRYRQWGVVVELDGREAHPADGAFRDMTRDNELAVAGQMALRFGWRDTAGSPCAVAVQVGSVLADRRPGAPLRAEVRGPRRF